MPNQVPVMLTGTDGRMYLAKVLREDPRPEPHIVHLPRPDVHYAVQDRVTEFKDWPRAAWPIVVMNGVLGYVCLSCGTVWAHELCRSCCFISEAETRRIVNTREAGEQVDEDCVCDVSE